MIKLYLTDSYIKDFSATVTSVFEKDGRFEITLDKTAFYPEGGGQYADKGVLGGLEVLDVYKRGEEVVHLLSAPLEAGSTVEGKIDFETRFSRMQSHSGEHIVSGIVHSLFGYNNVGFHLGDDVMTVDFDGPLTDENIVRIEEEANRAVWRNMPITVSFPETLDGLDCRSKLELKHDIRVITIGDVDVCACAAPHPKTTGEIGVIKIISAMNYKKGTRIEMLAGMSAYRDYRRLNAKNKEIMALLSAKRDETLDAVKRQNETLNAEKAEKNALKKRLALAELRIFERGDMTVGFVDGAGFDELRFVANSKEFEKCIIFSKSDEGLNFVISFKSGDVSDTAKALTTAFQGKGGGKGGFAQGKIAATREEDILKHFE